MYRMNSMIAQMRSRARKNFNAIKRINFISGHRTPAILRIHNKYMCQSAVYLKAERNETRLMLRFYNK